MRITPCKLLSLTPYANERWLTNLTLWGQLAGRRCRQKAGPKNSVAWRSSRYDLLPADVAHDRSSVSSLCQFFWRGCRDRCRRTSKTMTPARPALAVSESVRSPRRVRRLSASVRRTVRTCTPETRRSSWPCGRVECCRRKSRQAACHLAGRRRSRTRECSPGTERTRRTQPTRWGRSLESLVPDCSCSEHAAGGRWPDSARL